MKRKTTEASPPDLRAMIEAIVQKVSTYNPHADRDRLWEAYRVAATAHAGQVRRSGEPFLVHGLTVADILADLHLDVDTIIAGMLHDTIEDTGMDLQVLRDRFGASVAAMVDGMTKISEIRSVSAETRKAENYRKLILSIAQDPRTVLIKLADRLHNMRTIGYLPRDRQRDIAQETLDVFAPLAHRFGMARIRWELEDLAFKTLQPERYWEIESGIAQTRAERERAIEEVRGPLSEALKREGVEAVIAGRPKHFWSIYNKMKAQGIGLDRVYDLLALRVLVETKADCYHVLGTVHSLFPPIHERIKDYIASPKPNLYQSLHTTVQVPSGKYIEIQIRTHQMHEACEIGFAAHWKYKEGGTDETDFGKLVRWLRQIMEWQEDVTDPKEFMEALKIDFFQDEVFVFSPGGDLFQLPRGATPLDFAFRIHSEVGLHCVGAKVNDRIVSLRTPLQNRDKVEILTGKAAHPSTSWLEIVKTSRAKHHIRRWIKATQFQESIKLGRDILERELTRRKLRLSLEHDLVDIAQEMGYRDVERLLAAVGSGDLPYQKVISRVEPPTRTPTERMIDLGKDFYETIVRRHKSGVRVAGFENIMVRFARCCQPIPGDEVAGIITRGRGVTVHRVGCRNLADERLRERQIDVSWDSAPDQVYVVKIIVTARDRRNLLAELGQVIAGTSTNIRSGEFAAEGDLARATMLVEVHNLNNLQKILRAISRIPDVEKVERYQIG